MKNVLRPWENDIRYRTSRSGGKGGQHVNKAETRVELIFSVRNSVLLTDEEKCRVYQKLASYINARGELILTCDNHRSQVQNKEEVTRRFIDKICQALKVPKKRIATTAPLAVKVKIRTAKKRHSEKKQMRSKRTRDYLS
ncbi:MAG: aminoacyl-tRNA hydrolase [Chitinophagales bacterium]|nr:aminoacyl-tRNA hydrolase [Chitinophagales bacterium]MDW8419690.1 alternative ribosome rescue aminoacyl-tRNA hydrolase ArfB [Chitinophagales bacterium]